MLTAAHCICQFYDEEVTTDPVNKYCDPNPTAPPLTQIPPNQQTERNAPRLNHITIMVGDKDYEYATTIDVQDAYVMQTQQDNMNRIVLKDSFDIGIINADNDCDITRLSNNKYLTVPEM